MIQQKLFDSITSEFVRDVSYKQALDRKDTGIQRNAVKKLLQKHPEGITDFEICVFTGISRSSVTARRNEICGVKSVGYAKIVTDSGECRLNTLWGMK